MAVKVTIFPQPKVYFSLEAGGTLTVGQTYYFIGFFQKGSAYYGSSVGDISEEYSITPTAGYQKIKAEWWQDGGDYTGVVQNGSDITITATAHGRSVGDTVYLRGGAYDGTYTITAITTDTFDITATYSSDDTGKWFADIGKPAYSSQIVFKWDKYSMINSGTGKPYQWLNMNDPANTGSEWDGTYGHRKWTCGYYEDSRLTGTSNVWEQEATAYNSSNYELYDGAAIGSTRYIELFHPTISFRDNDAYYKIDSHFPRDRGTLCIIFEGTDTLTTNDLIDALLASPYTDHYYWSNKSNGYDEWIGNPSLTIFGSMYSTYNLNTELTDLFLTMVGGQAFFVHYSKRATMRRCVLNIVTARASFWGNPEMNAYDTTINHIGNAFILDNLSGSGIAPKGTGSGSMTFYESVDGFNMIGGNQGGLNFFQFRYPDKSTPNSMSNMFIKDFYISVTYNGYPDSIIPFTNVAFENDGLQNYDMIIKYIYQDDKVCEYVLNCTDVSSNRSNGQIIIRGNYMLEPASINDIAYFRYGINLTVLNSDGTPIDGADVTLVGEEADSDITDADGKASVVQLGYTSENPQGVNSGYWINSDWYKANLTITKAGYGTYKLEDIEIHEGKDWTIVLPASGTETKIYDSTIYNSTIY